MMVENPNRFTVELPEGRVYVEILPAVTEEWHDREQGSMSEDAPALRITTYPAQAYNSEPETIKYRGREYSIDCAYVLSGSQGRWLHHRKHYTKGYQNAEGNPVDWKSGARRALDAIAETDVRDDFVSEHPEWADVSQRLRIEQDLRSAEEMAVEAAKALREAEAKSAALRSRLAGWVKVHQGVGN